MTGKPHIRTADAADIRLLARLIREAFRTVALCFDLEEMQCSASF
jgi:hypothetical protein